MISSDYAPPPAKAPTSTPAPQVFPMMVRLDPSQLEEITDRVINSLLEHFELQASLSTLTADQVAALNEGWTTDDVHAWTRNGSLRGIKSGRKGYAYPAAEVKRFLESNLGKHVATRSPSRQDKIRLRSKGRLKEEG
jgi:hypothetical protein